MDLISNCEDQFSSDCTPSKKIKRSHVTVEQKEFMASFIIENPELVTLSSTKENERVLWEELKDKLNNIKPEKTVFSWKNFLVRWKTSLFTKSESDLTRVDSRFKNFLTKVLSSDQINGSNAELSDDDINELEENLTSEEISNELVKIEKEKSKLILEVDENDYKIIKYRNMMMDLKKKNNNMRKVIKKLKKKKMYLILKKKNMESMVKTN